MDRAHERDEHPIRRTEDDAARAEQDRPQCEPSRTAQPEPARLPVSTSSLREHDRAAERASPPEAATTSRAAAAVEPPRRSPPAAWSEARARAAIGHEPPGP